MSFEGLNPANEQPAIKEREALELREESEIESRHRKLTRNRIEKLWGKIRQNVGLSIAVSLIATGTYDKDIRDALRPLIQVGERIGGAALDKHTQEQQDEISKAKDAITNYFHPKSDAEKSTEEEVARAFSDLEQINSPDLNEEIIENMIDLLLEVPDRDEYIQTLAIKTLLAREKSSMNQTIKRQIDRGKTGWVKPYLEDITDALGALLLEGNAASPAVEKYAAELLSQRGITGKQELIYVNTELTRRQRIVERKLSN